MNRCVKKIFETRTIISYDLKTKNDGKCQNNHHILNLVLGQTKFAGFWIQNFWRVYGWIYEDEHRFRKGWKYSFLGLDLNFHTVLNFRHLQRISMSSKFDFDGKTHGFSEFNHQSIKFEVFCNSLYLGSNQHYTLLWMKFGFSQDKPIRNSSLFEK